MALWALGDAKPEIAASAFVHPDAHLIGRVIVRDAASVWPGAVLRADLAVIDVGEGTSVQDNCVVHPGPRNPTRLGRDSVIGHCVHLEGVVVEDCVLIGSGSVLLEGCEVRTGGMVAAGALVTKGTIVPSGKRAQGVPARMVPNSVEPEYVREQAGTYRRLAARYRDQLAVIDRAEVIAS